MKIDFGQKELVKAEEETAKELAKSEAIAYLQSTDWYAVQFLETGKEIPEDIQQKRADARDKVAK
ncbi:hypothetical protein [Pseudomonas phage PMBT14]|uniref:Uncharacterized protein n=1 Tax=Pseudomonas phage PMBT14 TaxID=2059855 RepID=A0A2I6PI48_9CAUD|nr:tail fiber assembly [Pseudomonas phage PMBT14]AUM59736.1 hypothetical protein [Pseudomonas phage PMBT14]